MWNSDQHDCHTSHSQEFRAISQYFQVGNVDSDATGFHRFKKTDLRNAKVINQVDRKFIACLIDDDDERGEEHGGTRGDQDISGPALVLIDQHAADERVRVERFLKELCLGFLHGRDTGEDPTAKGIRVRELSPPAPVLLTRHEALRLGGSEDIQTVFRRWGFHFSDLSKTGVLDSDDGLNGGSGYVQVLVQSIPEVVGDKVCICMLLTPNCVC